MDLTLTINDKLAADLRALADARGLSVDELGRQALQAGLEQLTTPLDQLGIADLGPLHTTPPTAEQILRMRSPIIAPGPIPERTLKPLDVLLSEITNYAD
jgi:hypothetical protein